jgi:peptidoglycan L-alanyl-D-glutamate endopeptidase CwlK
MYVFGKTSTERLDSCHHEIQLIMRAALEVSQIDFGIAEGYRTVERQKELFDQKLSKIDGINQRGKHNYKSSCAADIYAYVNGKASWSEKDLCYLGGLITGVANRLKKEGKISSNIRWGGNWDGDGVIVTDQGFIDLPHFELV